MTKDLITDTDQPPQEESLTQMSKNLARVAIPIIVGQIFSMFVEMLNLVFAGHLGDPVFVAAAGLGNMYANVTCLLVIYGLNSAIATLVSQAYGSGNLRKAGIYLNKGRIAILLFFIPIFGLMFLCETFLLALRMDPETARQAQVYTYGLVVALFFQAQFDATRQYLNALQKSQVITNIMIFSSFFHCGVLYIMVIKLEMGIIGASVGTIITYFLNTIIVTVYCKLNEDLKESFFFPTLECFENLWEYFSMGLPSSAMISLEWWSFEIQAILASYISVVAVGSMVILINTLTVLAMIPFGAQIAAAVFVGKSMGEGNAKKGQTYTKLIVIYTFLICILCSVCLVYFNETIARIFTNNDQLLAMTIENYKYIAIFLIVHGIGMSVGGGLRGIGKQSVATWLIFAGFFLFGHPVSVLLGFYFDLGMKGLIFGFCIGSFAMGFFYLINLVFLTDWQARAIAIRKKMRDDLHDQKLMVNNPDLKANLLH
ncbi:multidrug and toxin extrusion protein 2-like [Stylonychia lemnae]|uniref:Multidrug and toxin extrusion protein 2-like n=1 Tax=Stylonychia lemnae TaxID=5949 RepID=A0A078AE64_STYLE|nr:multidrug and toxin extrusion protein 2-like [Stylonychia lemnae]|eukprot:CDW80126.1 multidrug and toxin extrusion protein 2-like [Stylonychia lemnae]